MYKFKVYLLYVKLLSIICTMSRKELARRTVYGLTFLSYFAFGLYFNFLKSKSVFLHNFFY